MQTISSTDESQRAPHVCGVDSGSRPCLSMVDEISRYHHIIDLKSGPNAPARPTRPAQRLGFFTVVVPNNWVTAKDSAISLIPAPAP